MSVTASAPAPVNIAARKSLLGGAKKAPDDPAALKATGLKLAREEIEAKYPGIPAAWDELISMNVGYPVLTGEFAKLVCELRGEDVPRDGKLPGTGELVDEGPFTDPRELPDLVAALRTNLAERGAEAASSAATPTPTPATTAASSPSAPSLLPPDAPASDPAVATQSPADEGETEAGDAGGGTIDTTASDAGPPRRAVGRPKGSKNKPKVPEIVVPSAGETTTTITIGDRVVVYIDCAPSCRHESLAEMVHAVTVELNKRAGSAGDFRLVGNDHELAYGRWKGLVASMVRAVELPPGHYVLRGAAGDVAGAVADALRDSVAAAGGVVVQ